jgi:predicted ArsR family transcriptional regulator
MNGQQLTLDEAFAATRTRRRDPDTSFDAAQSMRGPASVHCALILNALRTMGPASASQLAARTGLTQVQIARRLPEIPEARPTEQTRKTASGRQERVWCLTTAA